MQGGSIRVASDVARFGVQPPVPTAGAGCTRRRAFSFFFCMALFLYINSCFPAGRLFCDMLSFAEL